MAIAKPNIRQPGPGDTVCIYVGDFDPPTIDARRVVDAMLARPDVSGVWLCPLSGSQKHVWNMGTMFCAEYAAQTGKLLTFCGVARDKGLSPVEMAAWARKKYPDIRFKLAGSLLCAEDTEPCYYVRFFGQPDAPAGTVPVSLDKFHSVNGIRERIVAGHDESKNVSACVWEYIQKHKLYR